jgi:peptidoglycan/LPS O-acetylase OafA/YrhL
MKYKPEIDGLRALSIFFVIFYHAKISIDNSQILAGGLLGVDIFFVISGYLISLIILKEYQINNNFNILNFYKRRIRRIIPVYLFIICISIPFAWYILLPNDLIDYSKSVLYSLTFISNFYFYFDNFSYDNSSSLLKPFLHTWSLSVEEQFYLIIPLLILILIKFKIKFFIILLILFSMSLGIFLFNKDIAYNFYLLPSRAWQFIAGAIIAYSELNKKFNIKSYKIKNFLILFGILSIFISGLLYNKFPFNYPLLNVLVVFGSSLIIKYSYHDNIIIKILSFRIFTFLGLISYSLYLWHFPLFAFNRITNENQLSTYIYIFPLLLILSIFTYYFIEKKFRDPKFKFKYIILIFTPVIISISFFCFASLDNGFKNRVKMNIFDNMNFTIKPYDKLYNEKDCLVKSGYNHCIFNYSNENKSIIFIGDSHLSTLAYDFKDRIVEKKFNKSYNFKYYSLCLYNFYHDKNYQETLFCNKDKYIELKYNHINKNIKDGDIVVIGGSLSRYIIGKKFNNKIAPDKIDFYKNIKNRKKYIDNLLINYSKSIDKLLEYNIKLVIIYPIPEHNVNPGSVLFHKQKLKRKIEPISEKYYVFIDHEEYKNWNSDAFDFYNSIQHHKIYKVDPSTAFCNNYIPNKCVANDKDYLFYYDDNHLSLEGTKIVNDLIYKEIFKFTN